MVGSVMARYGDAVAWHRVVSAAGVTTTVEAKGRARLVAEGTPMRGDRVDLRLASWYPPD
jgi:alkylated DNA nucleotide flippase Atl1